LNPDNLIGNETITETKNCTISLFNRNTVRIETKTDEIFLDTEDIKATADKIDNISHARITELDRRILSKISTRKNMQYAELAKKHRINAHNGDYTSIIQTIEREEETELYPQEILERLDEIVDRTITRLEQQTKDTERPQKPEEQ
jgi:hypothetical protein